MGPRGFGRPGGRRKDQEKGAAILDAAWDLILEQSVGAVSIEAVAARASVSKVTVYAHFTDRPTLFEATVRRRLRAVEAMRPTMCDLPIGLAVGPTLEAFGIRLLSFVESEPFPQLAALLMAGPLRHSELRSRSTK